MMQRASCCTTAALHSRPGHTGELMKQAERYLSDGVHPRVIVEGFEVCMYVSLLSQPIRFAVDRATLSEEPALVPVSA